ncbi:MULTISPECIES: ABC transporter permease [unclassified Streptococcus]|uniref:ABC transporter permease n=1 Tax=unclassified Streptococcus TaxID=2608887 RepID=UPI0010721B3A|nr:MULTISPECIES: ABC transporter permease [unclassified Streptococcus]MBF0806108.1 ABC transporter permease [Streptococcus sp. 19428wA2_WM07]TFU28310.1 FtsX-like permease family protein [Streptococcus sp. WM07]
METWKFAIASIRSHKMRSFLTMLGIIIGVSAVVLIMAFGDGMNKAFTKSLASSQQNVQISYSPIKSKDGSGIVSSQEVLEAENELMEGGLPPQPEVAENQIADLLNIPGVTKYLISNSASATISYESKNVKGAMLTGISDSYFESQKYQVLAGRNFVAADYEQFARVVLLDKTLANKLFDNPENALNQLIKIQGNNYRIMGVFDYDKNDFTAQYQYPNGQLLMTNTQLAAEFSVPEIQSIVIGVEDVNRSLEIGGAAARRLTQLVRPAQGEYQVMDFSDQLAEIQQTVGIMQLVIGSIAGISLLVGGIGVMNIMLVSVTERTREIGLRKALGATRRNILTQFLVESVVLTLIGGFIGLALSYGVVFLIGDSLNAAFGGPPVISMQSVVGSTLFSITIGVIFGLLPANKASKLNPIEALRYE